MAKPTKIAELLVPLQRVELPRPSEERALPGSPPTFRAVCYAGHQMNWLVATSGASSHERRGIRPAASGNDCPDFLPSLVPT